MNTLPYPSQALASQGRYGDSTLVHMNPQEVSGLQALARRHGTSLTVNPQTGLPEAFNLKSLLPMVAGLALGPAGLGLTALQAGMLTGAATGLITKDPMQGVMAGLGGYGGAGLGAGFSAAGAAAPGAVPGAVPGVAGGGGAAELASVGQTGFGMTGPVTPTMGQGLSQAGRGFTSMLGSGPEGTAARSAFMGTPGVAGNTAKGIAETAATGVGGLSGLAKYGSAAAAPMMMGEMEGEGKELEQYLRPYDLDITNVSGTYDPLGSSREREQLRYNFRARDPIRVAQGGAIRYQEGGSINPSEADVYKNIANVQQMAGLGQMPMGNAMPGFTSYTDYNPSTMKPFEAPPMMSQAPSMMGQTPSMMGSNIGGSFRSQQYDVPRFKPEDSTSFREIEDKKRLDLLNSELANQYYSGGGSVRYQEGGLAAMMRPEEAMTPPMDGRFLRGNGDGMSDEIPASIEGEQDALLSDGEFVIPADIVSHLGNGSSEAGAKILYQMMDRVRRARTGKEEQAEEIDVEEFLPA